MHAAMRSPGKRRAGIGCGNSADDACTPSHTQRLYDAVTHERKHLHVVKGATHYYTGANGAAHMAEACGVIEHFLTRQW